MLESFFLSNFCRGKEGIDLVIENICGVTFDKEKKKKSNAARTKRCLARCTMIDRGRICTLVFLDAGLTGERCIRRDPSFPDIPNSANASDTWQRPGRNHLARCISYSWRLSHPVFHQFLPNYREPSYRGNISKTFADRAFASLIRPFEIFERWRILWDGPL